MTLFWSCSNHTNQAHDTSVFDLRKLNGRWEFLNNNTHQIEEWMMMNDKELKGRGFVLENGDTTFIEFLSIRESNGTLTYFAQVSDITSAEIVPFKLTAQSDKRIEFSNEGQDFPKKIVYELKTDTTMQAYIEGPREGNNIRIVFDFIKQLGK
jgi:hypothetical protein